MPVRRSPGANRRTGRKRPVAFTRSSILVIIAVVIEAIILLSALVPFALPRGEVWQSAAFLAFFASFL
jgi:hypothetical protein